jgi:hypothetical protein
MDCVDVYPIDTVTLPFNLSVKDTVKGYAVEDVGCFLIEEIPVYPVKFRGKLF